jgi:hypothetical protein
VNAVPGSPDEQSAYRSKLADVSDILMTIKILCEKYNILSSSIEIGLDGQQALEAACRPLRIDQPNFDLMYSVPHLNYMVLDMESSQR